MDCALQRCGFVVFYCCKSCSFVLLYALFHFTAPKVSGSYGDKKNRAGYVSPLFVCVKHEDLGTSSIVN
ncbi:hypothetical protein QVD17_41574 [Tagetes erecta]|uniref:Uncharacterized protein n=1 Tax=Tagetes erecta TaxID=13708 RepID=A0AAD8JMD3_TARER|nr:hypothetical protein QVD17_41574 [Tagetes erecta]